LKGWVPRDIRQAGNCSHLIPNKGRLQKTLKTTIAHERVVTY
jgi:hypothetical protein